jgi:Mrp family chromosome partitioning ATPase
VSDRWTFLGKAEDGRTGQLNGDGPVTTSKAERRARRGGIQTNTVRAVMADGAAPRTLVAAPVSLGMDQDTRRELTRLTHTLFLCSGGARAVAFSAVESGAGCSWVLVRIAQLLAEASAGSVCIVDANFCSPMLHTYLHTGNSIGLSDALVDTDPIRQYVQRLGGGLGLLSTGSVIAKAEPLLASSAFRARVDELRASFDHLLFDTPPLAVSSDALAVASKLDGLAMVVEAGSTKRETALKAAKDAAANNVRMLGVVLNKRAYPVPNAIYRKL